LEKQNNGCFGLAVQAYQKRAIAVVDWLGTLSSEVGVRIPVRLVKGAYWDTEIKQAQKLGLDSFPVFTRKTSTDVSYLACALAQSACRSGHSALYARLSRLLQDLSIAKADGRYTRVMAGLAKTEVLLLDDFGLEKLNGEQRRDLLEIVEDRHGRRSTILTSQFPLEKWHEVIGDPTLGDATLDRVVHNAYKIEMKGGSMRKHQAKLT